MDSSTLRRARALIIKAQDNAIAALPAGSHGNKANAIESRCRKALEVTGLDRNTAISVSRRGPHRQELPQ